MVVGKTAIAVNLGEPGEQPLDEVLEAGPLRMPRDGDALPRRERTVKIGADRFDAAPQRLDFTIARVGARQGRQRLDLLQENGDRLLEVEGFRGHLPHPSHENTKTRKSD